MKNKISDKDQKVWDDFLSKNESLLDKDINTNPKKNKKTKIFDLHGYSLDEANKAIEDLIRQSYREKISKLIIVTGKGLHSDNEKDPYISKDLSILKNSVPNFIKNSSDLMKMINKIQDAEVEDGGSGAFYIFIKKITK